MIGFGSCLCKSMLCCKGWTMLCTIPQLDYCSISTSLLRGSSHVPLHVQATLCVPP